MTPLAPLRIGALTVGFPVVLAPMAGYSDAVMRGLARRFHAGLGFTEVASAEGIVRGSRLSLYLLETAPGEAPVAAHVYGADPGRLAEAAAHIERLGRFQAIDLNCGCPVPKIVSKGAGAALMKDPERIGRIVRAMREAVALPITVKTRLGLERGAPTILDVARAAAESGAAAIAVHARYAHDRHAGPADWEALARVKAACPIPVLGNGGVQSARDVFRMVAETGVDGVMIGKAAIGNPWIFEEAWALAGGRTYCPPDTAARRALIAEHLDLLIRHKGGDPATGERHRKRHPEQAGVLHFRAHLAGYARGYALATALRRSLQAMRTPEDVMAAVDALLAGGRAPGVDGHTS